MTEIGCTTLRRLLYVASLLPLALGGLLQQWLDLKNEEALAFGCVFALAMGG